LMTIAKCHYPQITFKDFDDISTFRNTIFQKLYSIYYISHKVAMPFQENWDAVTMDQKMY
jgi:hypothetical protein